MKGVIFTCLEEQIIEGFGIGVWNQILAEANSDGLYISGQSYDDDDLFTLVTAIENLLNVGRVDIVRGFGEKLFAQLLDAHPSVMAKVNSLEQLLTGLENTVHLQVKKLYDSPNLPMFTHRYIDNNSLLLEYHSPRQLCILAEGLLAGAAAHFKQEIKLQHPRCTHHGHPHCELIVEMKHE